MLAVARPAHLPNPCPRYTRRLPKKPFSHLDFSYLIFRFKASNHGRPGNSMLDMPLQDETPPSKPHKSSNSRANSHLVVRQASGTQNIGTSGSPIEHSRGGSEVHGVSHRSRTTSPSRFRGPGPAQRPARANDSAIRTRASPESATYIDKYLAYRKKAFIKIFMERVCEWLDENVCPREEAYDYDGDCPSSSRSSESGMLKRTAGAGTPVSGQKRQLRGNDRDDENSEADENNDRDRNKKRTKTNQDDNRQRLACPYYKHDPAKYKNHRSCVGPGWHEIHRVKEHLYRSHRLFSCTRCFDSFKSDKALQEHLRAVVACPVRDKTSRKLDSSAGLDQETEKQLRTRKQSSKQDDVDRWYDMYYILFPGAHNVGNPPSPWYDDPASSIRKNGSDSDADDLKRRYECFLRRELPFLIQRELERDLELKFQGYEHGLMDRLSAWIQDSSARCAKIFENIPSPSQAAALDDPETARAGSRAASPVAGLNLDTSPGEPPDWTWPFGFPTAESFGNIILDPLNMDFLSDDHCQTGFDSAYGTGSTEGSFGAQGACM